MRLIKLLLLLSLSLAVLDSCKDACEDINCGPNGTCVDGTCNCDDGYSGSTCNINVCDNVDCGPNGTCNTTTGACECEEGYSGANCEINVCDNVDCGPNGTCNTTNGECVCDEGYEGDNCGTEIRSKYYGTYIGSLLPCLPALLAGAIPADQQEALEMTPIEVFESSEGINFVTVGSTNQVLDLNVDADLTEEQFIIPEFSQDVDVAIGTVTVTGSGIGKFIDEMSMEVTFDLKFKIDILEVESTCTEIFTKM